MCLKKYCIFLAFLVLCLVPGFSQNLAEAKSMINELLIMNERLESRLIERNQQLADRDERLMKLEPLLVTIQNENLNLKDENQTMQNLSQIRESFVIELKNSLDQAILERNISLGANVGLLVWLVIK